LIVPPKLDVNDAKWKKVTEFKLASDLEKIKKYDKKEGKTPAPYKPTPGLLGKIWDFIYDRIVMSLGA
jgi:hypothetical protein